MILDRLDCSFPMENVFASDFIKVTTYLLRSCWIYCDESVQESLQKGLLAGFGHLERRYYPNIARLGWYLRLWQESGRPFLSAVVFRTSTFKDGLKKESSHLYCVWSHERAVFHLPTLHAKRHLNRNRHMFLAKKLYHIYCDVVIEALYVQRNCFHCHRLKPISKRFSLESKLW